MPKNSSSNIAGQARRVRALKAPLVLALLLSTVVVVAPLVKGHASRIAWLTTPGETTKTQIKQDGETGSQSRPIPANSQGDTQPTQTNEPGGVAVSPKTTGLNPGANSGLNSKSHGHSTTREPRTHPEATATSALVIEDPPLQPDRKSPVEPPKTEPQPKPPSASHPESAKHREPHSDSRQLTEKSPAGQPPAPKAQIPPNAATAKSVPPVGESNKRPPKRTPRPNASQDPPRVAAPPQTVVSPKLTRKKRRIVVSNPRSNRLPVAFVVKGKTIRLTPGRSHVLSDFPLTSKAGGIPSIRIEFHRGGDLGSVSYVLTHGAYRFRVSQNGWTLHRRRPTTTSRKSK